MNELIRKLRNIRLRIERLDTLLVLEQIGQEEYNNSLKDLNKQIDEIEQNIPKKRWWQK